MRGMDDIGFNCQIVINEISRICVVGIDAAHLRRGEDDSIGTILFEPDLNANLIAQINNAAIGLEHIITPEFEAPGNGRTYHTFMAGNPNPSFRHGTLLAL